MSHVIPARLVREQPQHVQRIHVLGISLQDLTVALFRLGELTGLMMPVGLVEDFGNAAHEIFT